MTTAKLFVSAGAPVQVMGIDLFSPLSVAHLYFAGMGWPSV